MELFRSDVVGLCYLPVDWSFYLNHSSVFYEPLYDARNCNLHKAGPCSKHNTGIWNCHGDLHISRKTGFVVAVVQVNGQQIYPLVCSLYHLVI